jgi:hypothetical protein
MQRNLTAENIKIFYRSERGVFLPQRTRRNFNRKERGGILMQRTRRVLMQKIKRVNEESTKALPQNALRLNIETLYRAIQFFKTN